MAGFFQFGGRIGRLAYFGRLMAVVLAILLGAGIVTYVVLANGRGSSLSPAELPLAALAILGLTAVFVVWSSLALMTRRLRDIGLPPLPVVALLFAFAFFDHVALANLFRAMGWRTIGDSSLIGLAIQLGIGFALLVLPSDTFADPDEAGRATFDGPRRPLSGPPIDRRQPRRQFGLRGR